MSRLDEKDINGDRDSHACCRNTDIKISCYFPGSVCRVCHAIRQRSVWQSSNSTLSILEGLSKLVSNVKNINIPTYYMSSGGATELRLGDSANHNGA